MFKDISKKFKQLSAKSNHSCNSIFWAKISQIYLLAEFSIAKILNLANLDLVILKCYANYVLKITESDGPFVDHPFHTTTWVRILARNKLFPK